MRTRSINITIVTALLLLSAASYSVLDEVDSSLIDELREIDSFHPPAIDEPRIMMYQEWHYFNIIDEEQGLSLITTLKISGDIYDTDLSKSTAQVLFNYSTPDFGNITVDFYPITMAEFSNETPDIQISSSTITLTEEGYHVHVESADGQTVFDALFRPFAEPTPLFIVPYEPGRLVNWQVASPKMKVNGTLTTRKGTALERTYILKNTKGYHDHNWGYWLWNDDIGWDWGQASEIKNQLKGNDAGKYTFCFGNVTDNEHTISRGSVLNIWRNKKIIATFDNGEIQVQHYGMSNLPQMPLFQNNSFPMSTVLNADDGENSVIISFGTEHISLIPIPIGPNKYLVIWELTGTYEVNGFINGKEVSYMATGFLEYVA